MSSVLRHRPGSIGIELDGAGWVPIAELLDAFARHGRPISRTLLEQVVAGTDKRRFEVDGARIRAAQGHSVPVDLGLDALAPPDVLFHGTTERFLAAIREQGLRPGRRHHVHLSPDEATARIVGARRAGRTAILRIDAGGMQRAGYAFYRAANGVWLTAAVPPQWIVSIDKSPVDRA
jgi:putative RNA 2'-phosphotransferase